MKNLSLLTDTLVWILRWNQLSVVILVFVLLASALAVIYSAHMTRQMYSQLQTLQKEQDDLDSEYEKLLLEQSAWANFSRVDEVARQELNMKTPGAEDLVVVRQ
ncbi:MAG: cell division protein FtsL [Pseudomonadales bacterium]|nr:cell division protein FtsL [Pseudomonadales bacterium]